MFLSQHGALCISDAPCKCMQGAEHPRFRVHPERADSTGDIGVQVNDHKELRSQDDKKEELQLSFNGGTKLFTESEYSY